MASRLPTFLIIGAGKAGTTACYYYLKAHPEIYMSPVKEPRFFAFDGRRPSYPGRVYGEFPTSVAVDLEAYQRLFDGATTERALGEASPQYLSTPGTAERIRAHIPEVSLVAILRDPAERAYSQFLHMVRDGFEPERDFMAALDAEPDRIRDGWAPAFHYTARAFYHRNLSSYFAAFDPSQIRVYLYEDFRRDTARVLRDMYAFVGVNPDFLPDLTARYNVSGVPKSRLLFTAYDRLVRAARAAERRGFVPGRVLDDGVFASATTAFQRWILERPRIPAEAHARLRALYREDTLKLQGLIGRDLSDWL
jgi:Sulfotransferase family